MGMESADNQHSTVAADHAHAVNKMSDEIDVIQRLKMTDPGKTTLVDSISQPRRAEMPDSPAIRAELNRPELLDPDSFMKTTQALYDHANSQHKTPVSKSTFEEYSHDPTLTPQERAAASLIYDNFAAFGDYASSNPFQALKPNMFSHIGPQDLQELKGRAHLLELCKQHTELHDPKVLASVLSGMWIRMDGASGKLTPYDYLRTSSSNKFNDQERAAAYLVANNFDKISTLSGRYTMSQEDFRELSKLSNKPTQPAIACDDQQSVAGNALVMGVAVAALSSMLGSKQSMKNGMVAAASAAATTELVNKANCPNPDLAQPH